MRANNKVLLKYWSTVRLSEINTYCWKNFPFCFQRLCDIAVSNCQYSANTWIGDTNTALNTHKITLYAFIGKPYFTLGLHTYSVGRICDLKKLNQLGTQSKQYKQTVWYTLFSCQFGTISAKTSSFFLNELINYDCFIVILCLIQWQIT